MIQTNKLTFILFFTFILLIVIIILKYSCFFENYEKEKIYVIKPLNTIEFTNTFIKKILNKDIKFNYSNSSIIENPKNKNNYLMNVRCVNYNYLENKPNVDGDKFITINKLFELNNNLKIINNNLSDDNNNNDHIVGIEDIRLYNNDNDIYYSGSYYDKNVNDLKISHNKYKIENDKLDLIPNLIEVNFKTHINREKNWVYFNYDNEIHIIYQWYPLKICKIIDKKLELIETKEVPKDFEKFRGSSCGIIYDDRIWFIVHSRNELRIFYHYFVCFDKNMNLIKYSKPFIFENVGVEYTLSFIIKENKIIIPYTVKDTILKIGIYDKNYLFNDIDYIII